MRGFFERDTKTLPAFYERRLRKSMGTLWEWLPEGAIMHDEHAHLKSSLAKAA